MKTVTIKDFIDAIDKNGLTQARGTWFKDGEGNSPGWYTGKVNPEGDFKIRSACAVGQAVINLGISLEDLKAREGNDYHEIVGTTEMLNDDDRLSCSQIAESLRVRFSNRLDEPVGTFIEFDYTPYIEAK